MGWGVGLRGEVSLQRGDDWRLRGSGGMVHRVKEVQGIDTRIVYRVEGIISRVKCT
jgi:hypothetical protein